MAELRDHNMALRVEAGQARQLLQLRTEALAHTDAQLQLLLRSQAATGDAIVPVASHVGEVQPSAAAEAAAARKEVARLRAALAASEGQRKRDAEAAERAAAALKAQVERLRVAARPGTAPPGPTTPDRRSGPPARRGSGSSAGRSDGPPADAATQYAGLPATLCPAPDSRDLPASLQLDHRWQYSAEAAGPMHPGDNSHREQHAELATVRSEAAQWQERCAVLEEEMRWMQALAAAPGPAAPADRPDAFPLDRYLSASPPAGLSIQSAWQQLSAGPAHQQSPFSGPELPQATAAASDRCPKPWPGVSAGSCGDSVASSGSEPLVDTDMDALLQSLEAAVLKSSLPQV